MCFDESRFHSRSPPPWGLCKFCDCHGFLSFLNLCFISMEKDSKGILRKTLLVKASAFQKATEEKKVYSLKKFWNLNESTSLLGKALIKNENLEQLEIWEKLCDLRRKVLMVSSFKSFKNFQISRKKASNFRKTWEFFEKSLIFWRSFKFRTKLHEIAWKKLKIFKN